MTRKLTLLALVVIGSLFLAGSALAAAGTASASVTVVEPLALVQVLDMAFGTIAPPSAAAQDFVLSAAGVVDDTASDGNYFSGAQAAQFTVDGSNGETVTVSPSVTADFTDAGLSLGTLVASVGGTLALDGTAQPINIGGTLNVATGAAAGAHVATIQLEVLYQ